MTDTINHPAHYTMGGIEVIDAIEAWGLDFRLANAVKYIARAGKKDPAKFVEDLKKARWYVDRVISKAEAPKPRPAPSVAPPESDFASFLDDAAQRIMADLAENRERYVRAWIAETGFEPHRCRLVERDNGDGSRTITVEAKVPTQLEGHAANLAAEVHRLRQENAKLRAQVKP